MTYSDEVRDGSRLAAYPTPGCRRRARRGPRPGRVRALRGDDGADDRAREGARHVETWCCACGLGRLRCWNPTTSSDSSTSCGALEATPVRVPTALWLEETGDVLGRPFFVMERVAATSTRWTHPMAPMRARTHPPHVPEHGRAARGDPHGRPRCDRSGWARRRWQPSRPRARSLGERDAPGQARSAARARALVQGLEGHQTCAVSERRTRPRRRQAGQLRVRRRRSQRGVRLGDDHRR